MKYLGCIAACTLVSLAYPMVQNSSGNQILAGFGQQGSAVSGNSTRVFMVDGATYAKTEAGIQSAINAAVSTGGGIVDARAVPSITLRSGLHVGSDASPNAGVTLLVPKAATWSVTITDGVSCGITVHNKSTIIGLNGQGAGNLFVIAAASASTKAMGMVCTDPSPPSGGQYVRIEGLTASNMVGATLSRGALVIQHVFDNSVFRDLVGINSSGIGAQILDACCGTSFYNLSADGLSGSGAMPLVIGNSTVGGGVIGGAVNSAGFFGASIGHAGAGLNEISFASMGATENVNFYNLYMEPSATDIATPLIRIPPNVHGINIFGAMASNFPVGSIAYMVDIASWAGPCGCIFHGLKSQKFNLINDHITGVQTVGAGNFGQAAGYVSGPFLLSSFAVGGGSPVTSSGAGGTMAAMIASGTAAMTTASIAAGTCGPTVTVPAKGVLGTDAIVFSYSAAPAANSGGLEVRSWPTSGNVNFAYCNAGASGVTPKAASLNWSVMR
jgi:hypothetical protein